MTFLLGLVPSFIPEKFRKAAVFVMLAVLLLGAIGTAKCAYDRSVIRKHDAAQQLKIERDKAAQAERERLADQRLQQQRQIDQAAAAGRTKEIDDATRNIPDQSPSARQRARACLELRREAKAHGRPQPACYSAPAP